MLITAIELTSAARPERGQWQKHLNSCGASLVYDPLAAIVNERTRGGARSTLLVNLAKLSRAVECCAPLIELRRRTAREGEVAV